MHLLKHYKPQQCDNLSQRGRDELRWCKKEQTRDYRCGHRIKTGKCNDSSGTEVCAEIGSFFFFFSFMSPVLGGLGKYWQVSLLEMQPLIHTGGSHHLICALRCGRRKSKKLGCGLSRWWSLLCWTLGVMLLKVDFTVDLGVAGIKRMGANGQTPSFADLMNPDGFSSLVCFYEIIIYMVLSVSCWHVGPGGLLLKALIR